MRSRLEARAAAAFDRLRITWDYEPGAFASTEGSTCQTSGSPDFRLSIGRQRSYIEVKPTADFFIGTERAKAERIIRTTELGAWLYLVTEWDLDDLDTLFRVATDADVERYCAAAGGCASP